MHFKEADFVREAILELLRGNLVDEIISSKVQYCGLSKYLDRTVIGLIIDILIFY